MERKSNFQGRPQDYLNWFELGYARENQIHLPPSQTGGLGLERKEEAPAISKQIPMYRRYDLGTSYVNEHIDAHQLRNQIPFDIDASRPRQGIDLVSTVDGTAFDDEEEANEESKISVYFHYDFQKYNDAALKLPVQEFKKEILEKVENYSVTIVVGSTGSGKSTQVPQFILDDGFDNDKYVNVVVTQPRRIAAISLANRICDERGWTVGKLVGYQVGLQREIDNDTRITFATTEVLVQKLVNKKSLDMYTHIILDEVHERDQHTDFALLLVKKLLNTVSRKTKVILMSATIEGQKFSRYFATSVRSNIINAPIIEVSKHTVFDLELNYLEHLSRLDILVPAEYRDEPTILPQMYKVAIRVLEILDKHERGIQSKKLNDSLSNRGAVLMFLPGFREIETVLDYIDKRKSIFKWYPIPLHSQLTLEEQRKVFDNVPVGYRKIIVSTNIAESSITVKDIVYVIDFCLTKNLFCDPLTNYTSLKICWASKASCDQRAGRAGRVSDGIVIRLVEEDFYNTFEQYTKPEMCRTPLSTVILKTKLLDMGEPHALLALALDPPNLADIYRNILVLKQLGALSVCKDGQSSSLDGDLTFLGEVAANLPLDPHLSKLILLGHYFGCLSDCIIIASSLSLKTIHSRPFKDELNAFLSKVSWAYGTSSDCLAPLHAYQVWNSSKERGIFQARHSNKSEKEWAKQSYVQLNSLRDIDLLASEITDRLKKLKIEDINLNIRDKNMTINMLKMCIAAAFFPNYFKRSVPDDYERHICRAVGGHDIFSTVVLNNVPESSNILYEKKIKSMFKDVAQDPDITFQDKKAYVKFSQRAKIHSVNHFDDIPGNCPTAMHLALKMRQIQRLRSELVIPLYSKEETLKIMTNIDHNSKNTKPLFRRTVAMNLNSLKSLKPPDPSVVSLQVDLVHVEDPAHFWVQEKDPNIAEYRSSIETTIGIEMKDLKPLDPSRVVSRNVCLAPFLDQSIKSYYRARIEEVYEKLGTALVFFVDFGNSEEVPVTELYPMPESLYRFPMLARECRLSEIKPASKKQDGKWDPEATLAVKNFLYQTFFAEIYSVVHGVLRVRLHFKERKDKEISLTLNKMLQESGYAVPSEEFITSKRNNELRTILTYDKYTEHSNLEDEAAVNVDNMKDSELKISKDVCYLRGPISPLEMKFVAMTRTGASKAIKIDNSSVNSVAIDMEPQSRFDRMMVSALISLNQNETNLTLRDSTLMPTVPGMLSLCLLLFAPVVELRVNEEGTHYSGAIVGLGYDEHNGQPIYADEDIEFTFDFNFSDYELEIINQVRFLLNCAMKERQDLSRRTLKQTQDNITKLLWDKLFTESNRDFVEMESFQSSYKWNCIPRKDIIKSIVSEEKDGVYPLINGIKRRTTPQATFNLLRKFYLRVKSLKSDKLQDTQIVGMTCPICNKYLKTYKSLLEHINHDAEHAKRKDDIGF